MIENPKNHPRLPKSYKGFYPFKLATTSFISPDDYIVARDGLIKKDLIAFDGFLFQVLSLPEKGVSSSCRILKSREEMVQSDPATIDQLIARSLGGDHQA